MGAVGICHNFVMTTRRASGGDELRGVAGNPGFPATECKTRDARVGGAGVSGAGLASRELPGPRSGQPAPTPIPSAWVGVGGNVGDCR